MTLAFALALLIGVSLGLFGGGGSVLTVPLLVYGFGLEVKPAIATSLLVVGITSAVALLPHARAARVRWSVGALFGASGMVGAYAGGRFGGLLPPGLLLTLFGAMMAAAAIAMWRGRVSARHSRSPSVGPRRLRLASDGMAVGFATGLVGAGGGFLAVPALVVLGGLPVVEAIATSLLVVALRCFAGFAGYRAHVDVDVALAAAVAGIAVAGSLLGARLVRSLSPDRLRRFFALFLLAVAAFVVCRQLANVPG